MKLSSKHYVAEAVVLWCYDHRFWPALASVLKKNKIKRFDLISLAGGAKSLASPDKCSDQDFILEQIKKSVRLHQTKKVILTNHLDCGAYGGSKKFNNQLSKEEQFHRQELKKAKEVIARKMPNLKIKTIFIYFDKFKEII